MILFTGASCWAFLKLNENFSPKMTFYYFLFSAFACYFHLYGIFIIASQIIFSLFRKNKRMLLISAGALILSLILFLPSTAELMLFAKSKGREISGRWLEGYFWKELLKMLCASHILKFAIFSLLIFLFGLFSLLRNSKPLCQLYLISFLLIIIFTLIFRVFIYPRFLAFFIPFYMLGISAGIEQITRLAQSKKIQMAIKVLICLVFVILLSLSLLRYYKLGKQGFKKVARYLEEHYPQAQVISLGLADYEFLYYYPKATPVLGNHKLTPKELTGKFVVCSHPWSWAPYNLSVLKKYCQLEKVWQSAGYDENVVYLFRCF